jgi:hypothetical protein
MAAAVLFAIFSIQTPTLRADLVAAYSGHTLPQINRFRRLVFGPGNAIVPAVPAGAWPDPDIVPLLTFPNTGTGATLSMSAVLTGFTCTTYAHEARQGKITVGSYFVYPWTRVNSTAPPRAARDPAHRLLCKTHGLTIDQRALGSHVEKLHSFLSAKFGERARAFVSLWRNPVDNLAARLHHECRREQGRQSPYFCIHRDQAVLAQHFESEYVAAKLCDLMQWHHARFQVHRRGLALKWPRPARERPWPRAAAVLD